MASITLNDVKVALKKGATWGTAADCSSGGMLLRCSKLTASGGFAEFLSRDIGNAKKMSNTVQTTFSGTISVTCDLTYNQALSALVAGVLGTESTAAEGTAGQADYVHTITPSSSIYGIFWTAAWLIEDDRSVELQSVKFNKIRWGASVNDVGSVTIDGVYDKFIVTNPTNTPAKINALVAQSYQSAVFNGANAYFRLSSYGTAANDALTAVHNKSIMSYELAYERPITQRYVMRGANTQYPVEPRDDGMVQGSLNLKFERIDDSLQDPLTEWAAGSSKIAELYYEGDRIGTGLYRSHKLQFPMMKPLPTQIPGGHDVTGNTGLMEPTITYRLLSATAKPAGQNNADYVTVALTDHRSTNWTA